LGIFILLTVSLAEATINYITFFMGAKNLELRVNDIDFVLGQQDVNVIINLTVLNPSSYRGFQLKLVDGVLYYEGENHTVVISPGGPRAGTPYKAIETSWWELPPTEVVINHLLPPYSSRDVLMELNLKDEPAKQFREFFEKLGRYQENINWKLHCRVFLQTPTFLGTIDFEFQILFP